MKIRRIISAMTIIAMLAAFAGCTEDNSSKEATAEADTKESVSAPAGEGSGDKADDKKSEKKSEASSADDEKKAAESTAPVDSVTEEAPAVEGEKAYSESGELSGRAVGDVAEGIAPDSIRSSDKAGLSGDKSTDAIINSFKAGEASGFDGEAYDDYDYGDYDMDYDGDYDYGDEAYEEYDDPDIWEYEEEPDIPEYEPEIGLLTAGEWNDNSNWGFFTNLVNSQTITFPSFGIDPVHRTVITVRNGSGSAVVNASVELIDESGSSLWKAVTDKQGKAYLFAEEDDSPASFTVSLGNKTQSYELEKTEASQESQQTDGQQIKKGSSVKDTEVVFDSDGKSYKKTEIMFIVDTTGSMSDEILFLQKEFSGIAKEIGTQNTTYSVNFYRDHGDEYVTKCNPFTDDISKVQSLINDEMADGGGDTPEAVAEILDETLTKTQWSEDSVKLAFLIFDAPPHDGKEEMLRNAIKTAAEKGIRLIPVVSSGSERDTELFGRAIAITTGGTYVFLTDDSGIGGSHLEPIIGDYEVEKLYDLIIRVIKDYQQ